MDIQFRKFGFDMNFLQTCNIVHLLRSALVFDKPQARTLLPPKSCMLQSDSATRSLLVPFKALRFMLP